MAKAKKTTIKIHEVLETREKAIKVLINKDDLNPVWFPLHRIEIDHEADTFTATTKLIEEKLAEAALDKKAQAKADADELLPLWETPEWESERAIGIDVVIRFFGTNAEKKQRVFIPKSQVKNGCAPRWLVHAKVDELAKTYRNATIDGLLSNDCTEYLEI